MRFLFVDRILQLASPAASVRGIKHITHDDVYLSPDATGRLAFMPSIIGETLGQLTAWAVMAKCDFQKRPVAGIVAAATMHRPAYVGETLALESWIDSQDDAAVQYHGEVRVGSELVFHLEGALGPMLPMTDFIAPAVVRRQFAEINRPGEWPVGEQILSPVSSSVAANPLVLAFDAIVQDEPGVKMLAVKKITRAAPYFPDHFPRKPVLPMTVLLECSMALARTFLERAGLASAYQIHALQRIKMNDFVYPGDEVTCTVTIKQQTPEALILHFRTEVMGRRVCVLDIVLHGVE